MKRGPESVFFKTRQAALFLLPDLDLWGILSFFWQSGITLMRVLEIVSQADCLITENTIITVAVADCLCEIKWLSEMFVVFNSSWSLCS